MEIIDFTKKTKGWLSYAMIALSIMGLVTFSLFIHEEAFQTAMFGTWPAQDVKDWAAVVYGCDVMRTCLTSMKVINYAFGWVQPLAFISYRRFAISGEFYVDSLEHKALAHAPEYFIGRKMVLEFTPNRIVRKQSGWAELQNGKLWVLVPIDQRSSLTEPLSVSGIVKRSTNGRIVIDARP